MLYGNIAGTKRFNADGSAASVYFEGDIFDYNLNGTINFSNLFARYNPQRKFFIYGTLGIGLSNWITEKKDLNTHEIIERSGYANNWTTEGMVMGGLGAYVNIADKVNLGAEWTFRGVNSDNMDITPGGFPYDIYSLCALSLTYNFNKRTPGALKPAQPEKALGPQPPKPQPPTPVQPQQQPETKMDVYNPALMGPPIAKRDSLLGIKTGQQSKKPYDSLTPYERLMGEVKPPISGEVSIPPADEQPVEKGKTYRIQVFAYPNDSLTAESIRSKFNIAEPVWREYSEGWYRYTAGSFPSWQTAKVFLQHVKTQYGVLDAFIARYQNGIRVPSKTLRH